MAPTGKLPLLLPGLHGLPLRPQIRHSRAKRAGSLLELLTLLPDAELYHVRTAAEIAMLGKSIIITDNTDWTTAEIVQAHLDRWQVEHGFRQSKHPLLVGVQPIRHWTDSKIRCHLSTCVVALTHLRRLERRLERAGCPMTVRAVMDEIQRLRSVLQIPKGRRKPERRLEQPTETQAEALSAFGYRITPGGVLQELSA